MGENDDTYNKALEILNKYNQDGGGEPPREVEANEGPSSPPPEPSAALSSTQPSRSILSENADAPVARPVIIKKTEEKLLDNAPNPVKETVLRRPRIFSCSRMATVRQLAVTGPLEADPTAQRDLDTASPTTVQMCEEFPCHYCIFVYSRPTDVDEDIFPFRRKDCIDKLRVSENADLREQVTSNLQVRDALRDRRIVHIELNTACKVRLSDLDGHKSLRKGLPRRRLTVAGPTFSHISVAVQLLEHNFPRLMQFALYPYRLPVVAAARYTSAEKLALSYNDYVARQPGCLGLLADIDEKGGWRKFLNRAPKILSKEV